MNGVASNLVSPTSYRNRPQRPRSEGKRARIIEVAMRHFAEHGFEAARVADIAAELDIAKGSVFQHFGSNDGLFFEVYKKAVRAFSPYLNVPPEVRKQGFFEVLRYWLVRTDHMVREDWVPYRVYLLGNYGTDLPLRREITVSEANSSLGLMRLPAVRPPGDHKNKYGRDYEPAQPPSPVYDRP